MEQTQELVSVATEQGIDEAMAAELIAGFSSAVVKAVEWKAQANAITVTDASQVVEMAQAHELRLEIKAARVSVEKYRVEQKAQYLRKGKSIDGMANVIKGWLVPLEEYLTEQENFVKIQEAQVEEARRIEADRLLAEKEEADRQAEIKRLAEQEAENVRLKAEAEEREKKHAEDQAEANRKLAEQQQVAAAEQEAIRKEEQAKRDKAEAKAARERERIRKANEAEQARIRKDAEARAEVERAKAAAEAEKREDEYQKELARARQVKCPKCGLQFDSAEHRVPLDG